MQLCIAASDTILDWQSGAPTTIAGNQIKEREASVMQYIFRERTVNVLLRERSTKQNLRGENFNISLGQFFAGLETLSLSFTLSGMWPFCYTGVLL